MDPPIDQYVKNEHYCDAIVAMVKVAIMEVEFNPSDTESPSSSDPKPEPERVPCQS